MRIKASDIFTLRNLFSLIFSIVLGTVLFLILFYSNGISLYNAMNASFIVAMAEILISILVLIANLGFFDIVAVGFANLFSTARLTGRKKYDGVYDYQLSKRESRRVSIYNFIPICTSGVLFLILSIVLRIMWQSTI